MKTIFFFLIAAWFSYPTELVAQQRKTVPPNYPPVSFTGDSFDLPPKPLQNCGNQSPDFAYYDNIANYIPDANTPVKTIEIAFNVFQKSDGSGNFQNTAADKQALITLLSWVNGNYSFGDLPAPSDQIIPIANEVRDRRIQFSLGPVGLERIYFYQNDNLQKADCFNVSGFSVGDLQNAVYGSGPQADPRRKNYLNIYFTEGNAQNNTSGCASMPNYGDVGDMYYVIYTAYSAYLSNALWVINVIMRHEVGHNLGLCHTYSGGGCSANCNIADPSFWDDIFGNPSDCPHQADWGGDAADAGYPTPGTHRLVTNNILGGNKDSSYASPKQVGEMHRALSLKTIRKYVSPCVYTPLHPITINSNQLWDFDIRLYSDLIVQSGVKLDVACKVTMPCTSTIRVKSGATLRIESGAVIALNQDAKITVERGGLLLVDGGKLTNGTANTLWGGIEVWGTSATVQAAVGAQGKAILQNGAMIENAMEGITTIKTDASGNQDWNYTGGIIQCTDATFRNSRRAVQFLSYTPSSHSYFKNCIFETTSQLADPSVKPYAFVSVYDMQGIKFLGCTFRNTVPNSFALLDRGIGIISIDANYYVDELTAGAGCKFQNLTYGVYASDASTMRSIFVSKAQFGSSSPTETGNFRSMYLSTLPYAYIASNKFDIGYFSDPLPYGLSLNSCTGYQVEDNEFFSTKVPNSIGTKVDSAGLLATSFNQIYRNRYHDIVKGLQHQYTSAPLQPTPFKAQCNEFTQNSVTNVDIAITSGNIGDQGTCSASTTTPAGNTFLGICKSYNPYKNVWDAGTGFTYFHHPGTSTTPCRTANVAAIQCSTPYSANSCPSTLISSCNPPCENQIASDLDSQISVLQRKLTAGDTPSLYQVIASNSSPDQIRNALMAPGPYLSDGVLIAIITQSKPLPPGYIKDIVISNSPVTKPVRKALNRISLPNGKRNQINAAQTSGTSPRTRAEQHLAVLQPQYEVAVSSLLVQYLKDTSLSNSIDDVIAFLSTQNNLPSEQTLLEAYLAKRTCSSARTLLMQITGSVDTSFRSFFDLMTTLCEQKKTYFQLSSAQKQLLEDLAFQTTNKSVAFRAQNILHFVYGELFPEVIEDSIGSSPK